MRIGISFLLLASFVSVAKAQQCATGSVLSCQASAPQPKPVYGARDHGLVGNGSGGGGTDNAPAMSRLLAAIGSNQAIIRFPLGEYDFGNITFPANVTLDFSEGGSIGPLTSIPVPGKITILGPIVAPARQIFYNATPPKGQIHLTGQHAVQTVYPEWFGASPSSSAATNTPAIQAAIYAAFGAPGEARTNPSGQNNAGQQRP